MTTLVFRDGTLAADSQITFGGDTIGAASFRKVRRLRDGRLCGYAGNLEHLEPMFAWLEDPTLLRPDMDGAGQALVISPDGAVTYLQGAGECAAEPAPFHVLGSGMAPALGALYAGASAVEAVRIACLVDPSSGGEVRSVRLKPAAKRKARMSA